MSLVVLPSHDHPCLTVRALARLMVLPAYEQHSEIRDQKYQRTGAASIRVPYYQRTSTAITSFVQSGCSAPALEVAIRGLTADIQEAESARRPQAVAKLKNNLRVLEYLPQFGRLRNATSARRPHTRRRSVESFEIRSTPDLLVKIDGIEKHVFFHMAALSKGFEEDEARRLLELAHWVEEEATGGHTAIADFEYWIFENDRMLSWSKPRRTTISHAMRSLPILAAVWHDLRPQVPSIAWKGARGE